MLYIQDILVSPEHQRQGIGRALLQRALARFDHVRQVLLLTDDGFQTKAFYEAMGMQDVSSLGARAYMAFRADN